MRHARKQRGKAVNARPGSTEASTRQTLISTVDGLYVERDWRLLLATISGVSLRSVERYVEGTAPAPRWFDLMLAVVARDQDTVRNTIAEAERLCRFPESGA